MDNLAKLASYSDSYGILWVNAIFIGSMRFVRFMEPVSEYWTLVTVLIETSPPDSITVIFQFGVIHVNNS